MKKLLILLGMLIALSAPAQLVRVLPSQLPPTNSLLSGDLITVTKFPGTASEKNYKMNFLQFYNWLVSTGLATRASVNALPGSRLKLTNYVAYGSNVTAIFPLPYWDVSTLADRATLLDQSNMVVMFIRHAGIAPDGADEGPHNNALYFPEMDAYSFQPAGVWDSPSSAARRNPRVTFEFSDSATWRVRPTNFVFDPWVRAYYETNLGEVRVFAHNNKDQIYFGDPAFTNNTAGETINLEAAAALNLSTFGEHYFTLTNYAFTTGKTITVTVNGVAVKKTNGVDWAINSYAPDMAVGIATCLNQITGVRAWVPNPLSYDTNIIVKPTHPTTTLTLSQDAGGGITSHNDFSGSITLSSRTNKFLGNNIFIGLDNSAKVAGDFSPTVYIWSQDGAAYWSALADGGDSTLHIGAGWAGLTFMDGTLVMNSGILYPNVTASLGNASVPWANIVSTGTVSSVTISNAGIIMTAAGSSSTNARVGGPIYGNTTSVVGAGTAATNLQTVSIGAHTLTNNLDTLEVLASGKFSLTGESKQVQVIYGSQAILDSGSQAVSNSAWVVRGTITRTGNTAQYCTATLTWGQGPWALTNATVILAQTNGIATTLKIVGTSGVTSSITNEALLVKWMPASK